MVGHGGSSAGSYLADPTSPIPSHCVSIVVTSTLRVNNGCTYSFPFLVQFLNIIYLCVLFMTIVHSGVMPGATASMKGAVNHNHSHVTAYWAQEESVKKKNV